MWRKTIASIQNQNSVSESKIASWQVPKELNQVNGALGRVNFLFKNTKKLAADTKVVRVKSKKFREMGQGKMVHTRRV